MTTNYVNTLIEVADDSPVFMATVPPSKPGRKTIANWQYEIIAGGPYEHTSDDVLFEVYVKRNGLRDEARAQARDEFFSKDQPCLRASPLTKRYGWGIHSDSEGRIAVVAAESAEYQTLRSDPGVASLKAMRSRRA